MSGSSSAGLGDTSQQGKKTKSKEEEKVAETEGWFNKI